MSHLIDKLNYFRKTREPFANGHGETHSVGRDWEDGYRQRWQHDKIVRSTHGVNCTGSCSWKIYVKNGLVTWETQQTDYPRTRADLPNHEPRGCPRGASYSWYMYSANRLKYPLARKHLLKLWRAAKAQHSDPVEAWASIVEDPGQDRRIQDPSRHGRLHPFQLGRAERTDRCGQRLYRQDRTARTGSSASRRFRPCPWSPTPPAPVTCR